MQQLSCIFGSSWIERQKMTRRAAKWTKTELDRATAVATKYGLVVEITQENTIRLVPGDASTKEDDDDGLGKW
jgi:hypothetical protein